MTTNTGQIPSLYTTTASVPSPPPYSTQQPTYELDQKYESQQQQSQQGFDRQQLGGTVPTPATGQQPQPQFQQTYPGNPGISQFYYPPGMEVQQQVPSPVLYAQQPMYVQEVPTSMAVGGLRTEPGLVDCPSCGKRGLKNTSLVGSSRTQLWEILCCVFFGVGCIPCLADCLKDVEHHCSSCGAFLTIYR